MKKFNVTYSGYKYAPESFNIYVNGKLYAAAGTQDAHDIAYMHICGKDKEAADHIKRSIRAAYKKPEYITIGFYQDGSATRYFFTRQLYADRSNLMDKLRIFKEYKRFLLSNNCIVNTYELKAGEFIPGHNTAPQTQVIEDRADITRPVLIHLV